MTEVVLRRGEQVLVRQRSTTRFTPRKNTFGR
jgi:hypothetical protein